MSGKPGQLQPGPSNLVSAPVDPACLDPDWDPDVSAWYKVSAVDIHGNESPFATVGVDGVIGTPRPTAVTGLAGIYPNPCNPTARIRFHLAAPGPVRIDLYDVAGRRVRTLLDASRGTGDHEVDFDGRDGGGAALASGHYFCRFTAGTVTELRTVTLIR